MVIFLSFSDNFTDVPVNKPLIGSDCYILLVHLENFNSRVASMYPSNDGCLPFFYCKLSYHLVIDATNSVVFEFL